MAIDLSRFSLEGKVAIVTGGGRGIGKAIALGFARAGASVVVTSRKLPDLEAVAAEIKSLGRESLAVAAHIGRIGQHKGIIDATLNRFGTIDILVNDAAVPMLIPIMDTDEKAWDVIMNLNVKGLFFLSQAVGKVMKERGGGKIINMASADAFTPAINVGAYSISKAAVVMVTKVLALEWAGYNIRVNAIAPGVIRTRMIQSKFELVPGLEQDVLKHRPMHRIGEPDEITGIAIYLASDASSYTTGQTFIVDGGELIKK